MTFVPLGKGVRSLRINAVHTKCVQNMTFVPLGEGGIKGELCPDAIDSPEAWDGGCPGQGTRIFIHDSGIDAGHPDLAPNLNIALARLFNRISYFGISIICDLLSFC